MKTRLALLLSSLLPFAASLAVNQSKGVAQTSAQDILDQETPYYCDETSFNGPTLVFRSDLGNARLIEFQTEDFGQEWSPLERCRAIAERAQEFHELKIISYLTWETMPTPTKTRAICISKVDADHLQLAEIDPNFVRLLFTLKSDDNPEEILNEIRGLSSISSDGNPLIH